MPTDFEREVIERLATMESTRGDLIRRITDIESTRPQVIASKLTEIADEVRAMKRAFYSFGFSVMGGAILFTLGRLLT